MGVAAVMPDCSVFGCGTRLGHLAVLFSQRACRHHMRRGDLQLVLQLLMTCSSPAIIAS